MHPLYRQLCRDHRNMQQLLQAMERLLADLDRRDRDPATLGLILDALDYISTYPDRWHHPLEDLAMQHLQAIPGADLAPIKEIQQEHRDIAEATRRMTTLFYAVANDSAVERSQLFGATQKYLELQWGHMDKENRHLFPQFERLLEAEDWDRIGETLKLQADPLFDTSLKRLYESLHHYVTHVPVDPIEEQRATA